MSVAALAHVRAESPQRRVERALAALSAAERPTMWIHQGDPERAVTEAREVEHRLADGEALPLAGAILAVKDNIDVAGMPTTAGCPEFAYEPPIDAPAVARLRAAGAIVIGKTNMDQFATGLVGTRSPYGAVPDAADPRRVAGGSSSGSAVAVALGVADFALGTDTAGSGRVPAAFQGIVGVKPTRGLISTRGVVPVCRSFDCVSVFARSVSEARTASRLAAGTDRLDSSGRTWPVDAPLAAPATPRIAVPSVAALALLSEETLLAFARACERLAEAGAEIVEVDVTPMLAAGALLYDGALLAERYAAVGEFIERHIEAVDATVAEIILAGCSVTGAEYAADRVRLDQLALDARTALSGADALVMPTAPFQPTLAEVAANPIEVNRALGTYTNFCNLLDMSAVAVPTGRADGGHFGVTLFGPAFSDEVVADLATWLEDGAKPDEARPGAGAQLLVVGAHMSGGPLNHELTARGGRLIAPVQTARAYRLYALSTAPPKPGLVRVGEGGTSIEGELWALPEAGLASLLHRLPSPMTLGRVQLADGAEVVGFLCEPAALDGARDITAFGGWRNFGSTGRRV